MQRSLHIYHINDLHSHFENWPQIIYYINQQRKKHKENGEACLFFDIGDFVDRSNSISEASYGKWNIELLNRAGIDAITIGNNEGITLAHEHLDELYEQSQFDVLVGNLAYLDGSKPNWLKPYTIYQLSDLRVGVIGLTVPFTELYGKLGWTIEDPIEVLKNILAELTSEVDVIVLLSHLGIKSDEKIAEQFPMIDLILGAHTHHVLPEGKVINDVLLCGAGKYGMYVGHVEVTSTGSKKANLVEASQLIGVDLPTLSSLQNLEQQAEEKLARRVTMLQQDLAVDWNKETPFISSLATSIRQWCQADIGMVNAGVLLAPLHKGIVTAKDIHQICPHPINPCVIDIPGSSLQKLIEQASTEEIEKLEIKGLGFRGKVMGKMIYDGVKKEGSNLYINNELLHEEKIYRLGTLDMFTFGYIFPDLANYPITYFMPELLRDIVQWQLSKDE
ncbi:MAG: bifunctional metallophosphatase/5'-nucleotidase [Bacillaceae bacterium]